MTTTDVDLTAWRESARSTLAAMWVQPWNEGAFAYGWERALEEFAERLGFDQSEWKDTVEEEEPEPPPLVNAPKGRVWFWDEREGEAHLTMMYGSGVDPLDAACGRQLRDIPHEHAAQATQVGGYSVRPCPRCAEAARAL